MRNNDIYIYDDDDHGDDSETISYTKYFCRLPACRFILGIVYSVMCCVHVILGQRLFDLTIAFPVRARIRPCCNLHKMTMLCALTIAHSVALALQNMQPSDQFGHEVADAVEVLKEILTQVRILPSHKEHSDMAFFCKTCLWSIRGILNQWDVVCASTHLSTGPLVPLHASMWRVEHPNRQLLLAEVESGLRFLNGNKDVFMEQPWNWLIQFLTLVADDLRKKKP